MLKLGLAFFCLSVVFCSPIDDTEVNNLPEVIRQSPSTIVRVVNVSSAAALQEEAIANVSSSLSNISLADIENDNLTHSLQLRYRERKKQERIIVIQAQILHRLRMNRRPNISSSIFSEDEQKRIATIFERMHHTNNNVQMDTMPTGVGDPFMAMQRLQSFYPSCSLPNHTDKALWEHPGSFRLYYDVPFKKHSAGSNISIMLAKLRLYKITGNSDPNFVGWNQANLPRYNLLETLINSRAANGISVSIYQYIKPLRMNKKEKKRLVDTKTLSLDYQGWVEFNVIPSLNYWLHHSNKNFGFDIEVEDAYGNKLNPNLYFQNLNCSSEIPQDPPFPNIMELHPDMGDNESSLFDNETYPTLDLQTAEVPRDFSEFDILAERLNDRVIRKRSSRRDLENTCNKEEVYVTFAEMGLDEYILWPQGVLWTFCGGSCDPASSERQRRDSFYSTWIHRLLRLKINDSSSTCVATSRESLPVILHDKENQVVVTVLEDVIPTSCGCKAT